MRRLVLGTVLIAALSTSACGSAASSSSAGSAPAPTTSASGAPSAHGGADGCATLSKDEVAKYALYAQLFPQVRTQSVLDSLRAGSITDYTPEAFATTLEKMEFLRGRGAQVLGDPGPSLDYYARVNDALKSLLAESDPVPQSAFDAYSAVVGSIPESLGKQLSINAALSELCTELG